MLIVVRTIKGKEIQVNVEPTDRLEKIKQIIEEREGIPFIHQKLISNGKVMMNEKKSVQYHKLKDGSEIHVLTFNFKNQIKNQAAR